MHEAQCTHTQGNTKGCFYEEKDDITLKLSHTERDTFPETDPSESQLLAPTRSMEPHAPTTRNRGTPHDSIDTLSSLVRAKVQKYGELKAVINGMAS
jgi:hypothetical protein